MADVSEGNNDRRRLPPWLLGLIIAAVLFLIGLAVFQALGFGDDPVLDPEAVLRRFPPWYG